MGKRIELEDYAIRRPAVGAVCDVKRCMYHYWANPQNLQRHPSGFTFCPDHYLAFAGEQAEPELPSAGVAEVGIERAKAARERQHRFAAHVVSDEQAERMASIRHRCLVLAEAIAGGNMPQTRETAIALTKLEEVMFWANAGIARNPA